MDARQLTESSDAESDDALSAGDIELFENTDDGSDDNEPLKGGAKLSTFGLASNMVLSITGTVVLGIGAQMKTGGWIVPPLLLIIGTVIISEMCWLVSRTIDKLQAKQDVMVRSYQDYAGAALGPFGHWTSSVTSAFSLLSMICNGLILLSQNLQVVIPLSWAWPGPGGSSNPGQKWWAVIISIETAVFCFVDIGHLLHGSAMLGPIITIAVVTLAIMGSFGVLGDAEEIPSSCLDGIATPNRSFSPVGDTFFASLLNTAQVASYCFFAFAVVVTVPTLKGQMAKPRRLVPASVAAFALVSTIFLFLMVLYYIGYGNLGPDNIIQGFRTDRAAGWWATTKPWQSGTETWVGNAFAWLVSFHLVLSDAIYVPCSVIAFEGWCPRLFKHNKAAYMGLRIGIILMRVLVATVVTSFVLMTSLTSSLFCVCNNILLPIMAFYKTGGRSTVGPLRVALHALIFAFGLGVAVLGTQGAIVSMVSSSTAAPAGEFPRPDITANCSAAFYAANKSTVA